MDKSTEALMAVRDTIKDVRNWSRGALCKDDKGNPVDLGSAEGHSYCLLGSVLLTTEKCNLGLGLHDKITSKIVDFIPGGIETRRKGIGNTSIIAAFNDSASHKEVIDVLNLAIQKSLQGAKRG